MSTATRSRPETKPSYKHVLTTPTDRTLHIERTFDAPREKVWKAMTDPKLLAQWWGRGNPLTVEKYEFEKGGHWRFVEHSDGQSHGFEGRFREITPTNRLSMTFEWDGMPGYPVIETMELSDEAGGKTRLNVTSAFFAKDERDGMMSSGMEGGMAQSYAALDRLLATL